MADIWSTVDGVTWVLETRGGFSVRDNHASAVFNGRIYVAGGFGLFAVYLNDVWSSADGVSWVLEPQVPPGFPIRDSHTLLAYDAGSGPLLWIIAGGSWETLCPCYLYKRDVDYSPDAMNWTTATLTANFTVRRDHTSVVFNGKMWVIGGEKGSGGSTKTDVWYSP